MKPLEKQYLCTKELIAEDGIHFKRYNCYTGETKIFDESLSLQGEKGVSVSFYGGNDYLKRLVYKGSIKENDDGTTPIVKAEHIILSAQEDGYVLLGVGWSIDGREVIKLDSELEVDRDHILEVRNTRDNSVITDMKTLKPINDKVKKVYFNKE